MQLIAEAYDLLRHALGATPAELAAGLHRVERRRPGLLPDRDHRRGPGPHRRRRPGRPFVDVVLDQAEQKGTGRWTVQTALDLGVPVTGIAEATFARALSGQVPQRETGGTLPAHATPWSVTDRDAFVEDVRQALYASKVVAYSQGFDQIAAASTSTAGTSTAARWPGSGAAAASSARSSSTGSPTPTQRNPELPPAARRPLLRQAVAEGLAGLAPRRRDGRHPRRPHPGVRLVAGLLRRDPRRAPARRLLQAQRDYFGAHTYRRTDREGTFHTDWSGDHAEHDA